MWTIVLSAFMFFINYALQIPFAVFILVVAPLFLVIFTYGSFRYSFRESITPEPVPLKGYDSRISDLEMASADVFGLGFVKKDSFYLKTIPDSVNYVFMHKSEPVYLYIHHFGGTKKSPVYMTFFDGDIELSTISSASGGMIPRPEKKLVQVFEGNSFEELLREHLRAVDFIKGRHIKPWHMPHETLKSNFKKRYREVGEHVRRFLFWPLRLIWWTVTQRGKLHKRSIEEQVSFGMIKWL